MNTLAALSDGQLVPGNPDVYYGARSEQLNRRTRNVLDKLICPTTQQDLPILPNFFVAVKGPEGTPGVALRQACYDGALGARGMYAIQCFAKGESIEDGNAHTITSTFQDGLLKMYSVHFVHTEHRPECVVSRIRCWAVDGSAVREGLAAFRNLMDWAREQQDDAIKEANQAIDARSAETSSNVIFTIRLVRRYSHQTQSQEADGSINNLQSIDLSDCPERNSPCKRLAEPLQQEPKRQKGRYSLRPRRQKALHIRKRQKQTAKESSEVRSE